MKTQRKPKFRQWWPYSMLKLVDRNWSVVRNWQYSHPVDAVGFVRYPPARAMKGSRNCEHVWPEGGFTEWSSTDEQLMSALPIAKEEWSMVRVCTAQGERQTYLVREDPR